MAYRIASDNFKDVSQLLKTVEQVPLTETELDLSYIFSDENLTTDEIVQILKAIPKHITSLNLSHNELGRYASKPEELDIILKAIPMHVKTIELSHNFVNLRAREQIIDLLSIMSHLTKDNRLKLEGADPSTVALFNTILPKEVSTQEQAQAIIKAAEAAIQNFYDKHRSWFSVLQPSPAVRRASLLEKELHASLVDYKEPQVIINECLNDPSNRFEPDSLESLLLDELVKIPNSPWKDTSCYTKYVPNQTQPLNTTEQLKLNAR
ncbi:hypothetical protein ACNVED_11350 [Legionella sp. D16C41]|uniref:hypothetical protein n=1 Tax=Legionella sp. D16C41 TaxID=3402688 RepID=UPI003AF6C6D9